ncbi:TetR/AcrR family transcriptional regulator [Chitinivorax sp. PXF-14]|uniref:TetR/AcrR family transcriptional regulator n=1 Tax=Chitinivorax sp. PXF-14 TaxID=3230488 RepID=UPI00346673E8
MMVLIASFIRSYLSASFDSSIKATIVAFICGVKAFPTEVSMNGNEMAEAEAPKKGRHQGGRSARVVAAVHAATLALLNECGYERMEIPEIAERAQVNKTSIYRRWPSKMELMLDVALAWIGEALPTPDTGSLEGDLTALLGKLTAVLATPFARGALKALIGLDERAAATQQVRSAFWNARFEAAGIIVERAIQRGELPSETNARHLLEFAAAPLFYRTLITGEATVEADIDRLARQACLAFGRQPARKP